MGKGFRYATPLELEMLKRNEDKRKHFENKRRYLNLMYRDIHADLKKLNQK